MKKTLSAFLTFMMIVTFVVPTFAADATKAKLELKQAIEIAKDNLGIETEGYDFSSSYSEDQDGKKNWYLNWQEKKGKNGSINVSIDADSGDITSFSTYTSDDIYSKIPKYSKEQALQAAADFAAKLQPVRIKETKILSQNEFAGKQSPYYSDSYTFTFTRMVNGIPYIDNNISVNVDKNTLKIKNYSFSWDDKAFPDMKKAISIEDAKKLFKDKLGIEASYNLVYGDYTQPPKAILAYTFVNGNKPIDAITGEVVNYSNYYPMYGMNTEKAMNSKADASVLTPEEDKNVEDTSKLISKEKAIEAVQQYFKIDSKYNSPAANLSEGYPKGSDPIWYFNWNYKNNDSTEYGYKSAAVDAATGELKSFSQSGSELDPGKDEKAKYTKEQMKTIAETFLKKIQPERFALTISRDEDNGNVEVQPTPVNYGFNYIKKVDGISYPFDTLNIMVEPYTGQIISYNVGWYEPILPKADGIISLDEAYKNFFEKQNFSLRYVKYTDYTKDSMAKSEIKLVYVMDNLASMIDAKTGELLDYNGKPIKPDSKTDFTDIKGYWAENEINLLADMGIITHDSDKYSPNEGMKQKDFIKILMKAVNPEYGIQPSEEEYDSYYEQAVNSKVIFAKERADEKIVSRADASKFLVRAMNRGYVADLKGVFDEGFKDVNNKDKNLGYESIISGLGIMSADDGYFHPTNGVTRGEAAVIIVRYLKIDATNKE